MANVQNNKLELLPHQEEAYKAAEKLFAEKGKAAVIFPTGCGKSFVLLKYILEHPDERILFLSPRHAIKNQLYEYIVRFIGGDFRPIEEIKNESGSLKQAAKQYIPNIECMLYQTIMGLGEKVSVDELIKNLKPNIIIVDEMHHLKTKLIKKTINQVDDDSNDINDQIFDEEYEAEDEESLNQENKWGQKFNKLLDMNPQAKLLGLSATPIRTDGANVVERIFNDAIASEISLLEAIEAGIIYPPKYVVPDFIRENELRTLLEKIEDSEGTEKEQLKAEYDELVKKSDQTQGIPDLLSEHITEKDGKYIIFCKDIEDMEEKMTKAQEWFGKIDEEPEIYGIHSKDSTSAQKLETFNNSKSKHLKLMYCVGMIDEGVHLNNISGVILAAKTGSRPTYLQRIGRAISSGKSKKQALVIDLVNNNEILQDKHNIQNGYEINDIEALEKLIEWIRTKNDGKMPEYSEDKSSKEKAMARRLARINNKYLEFLNNPNLLEELSKDKREEVQEIIEQGRKIGLFEGKIIINSKDKQITDINTSIETFLRDIEIKGIRKDFRQFLGKLESTKSMNMYNFEEYKAWCEQNGKLPRTMVKVNGLKVKSAKEGEKETEEQREQRLGRARSKFNQSIKEKQTLTEEEKEIKRLYEKLDEKYKEISVDMQNYEEYRAWCEKNGKLPRTSIQVNGIKVMPAKEGEKETEEQIERRLGRARVRFNQSIKEKQNITEEKQKLKRLYEELDEKFKQISVNMQNYEEYRVWCEQNGKLPRTGIQINGIKVEPAKEGEKETEEQREQRLGSARTNFNQSIKGRQNLTEEEDKIKRLYEELDEKYKQKNIHLQNFEEYKAWCEEKGKLPRTVVHVNGKIVRSAKEGEKETEEQREQRLGKARAGFFNKSIKGKQTLTEEEKEIKRLYEMLDEKYKRKKSARKLAQAVKGVTITEAQEAAEFLETITKEKEKEGRDVNNE